MLKKTKNYEKRMKEINYILSGVKNIYLETGTTS